MKDLGEENNVRELTETDHIVSFRDGSQNKGETNDQCVNFSSPTPVKTKEPLLVKCQETSVELPENYGVLSEFYGGMITSLRLLSLRNRAPTFKNISCLVKILTGREFLVTHLAQIKYLLPEAVQIDKILIHDDKTKCMKPDMKITLLFDVADGHCEESVFVALSNLFSSRLRDFYVAHPEDTNVPESALLEPFNQRSFRVQEDPVLKDSSASRGSDRLNLSHFSPSFTRFFSKKVGVQEIEKTNLILPLKSAGVINEENETAMMLSDYPPEASLCESTPVKLASSSYGQLVETPVQTTPLRIIPQNTLALTCEDENKSTASQSCKQPSSTAKKSLDFYCLDGDDTKNSPKEISASLPDLVLLIHKIFQSVNFCQITKDELIQKIILHNCEIDDRDEVEKQIDHLEKLVPDWFNKKLVLSGDILYNVKRESDLNMVRERINVI